VPELMIDATHFLWYNCKKKLRNFKPSLIPGVIWLIISTVLFCLPGSAFPKETWLEKIWFDKWVHIGIFLVMVFIWSWAFTKKEFQFSRLKMIFLFVTLIALLYGVGMEYIQEYLIPNRDFDLGDIAADAIGCVIGYILSGFRFIKK
jgi:VanZ family protein